MIDICKEWRFLAKDVDSVIIGDFNICLLETNPNGLESKLKDILTDTATNGNIVQLIEGATKFSPIHRNSLIDHVWTNCSGRVVDKMNHAIAESDHNPVGLVVRNKAANIAPRYIRKRNLKSYNRDVLRSATMKIDWEKMSETEDLNHLVSEFSANFKDVIDFLYPVQIIQMRKKYATWLSTETKDLMKQ